MTYSLSVQARVGHNSISTFPEKILISVQGSSGMPWCLRTRAHLARSWSHLGKPLTSNLSIQEARLAHHPPHYGNREELNNYPVYTLPCWRYEFINIRRAHVYLTYSYQPLQWWRLSKHGTYFTASLSLLEHNILSAFLQQLQLFFFLSLHM